MSQTQNLSCWNVKCATRNAPRHTMAQSGTKPQFRRPGPARRGHGPARPMDFSARPRNKNRPGLARAKKIACPDGPENPGWAEMGRAVPLCRGASLSPVAVLINACRSMLPHTRDQRVANKQPRWMSSRYFNATNVRQTQTGELFAGRKGERAWPLKKWFA